MPADAIITLDAIRQSADAAHDLLDLWCQDAHKKERLPWPDQVCADHYGRFYVSLFWEPYSGGLPTFTIKVYGAADYQWIHTESDGNYLKDTDGTSLLDGLQVLRAMLKEAK